jgi:hypothetical protein
MKIRAKTRHSTSFSRVCAWTCWRLHETLGILHPEQPSIRAGSWARHHILFALESGGEAFGERPHLTGGSPRRTRRLSRAAHTSLARTVGDKESRGASPIKRASRQLLAGACRIPGSAGYRSVISEPERRCRFCAGACCPFRSGVGTSG